ncbi:ADP-sugar pyrophosphatase isoform X1 [Chiloscyllium plagiosum]|uniref:ADP-sugar pyrophosphatase n=2 Tax=Hemiscylliidae TaxID=40580 RepID=UPI001CB87E58|nr:ADP-sugar pyrophosphatase isoform X1 [Chiloscyllium plagiosum]XP_043570094.1 ADP-sugar pyrophosphatase isoform X1 [Chiloscyllium plagiosum]XP_060698606.1 ADP-sugar pyrophosphatase [Hemiscyllium ocellatum]
MEPNNTANQSIVKEEVLAKGKWAQLLQTTYIDPTGKTRVWETVKRTTRKPSSKSDGVAVLAVLKKTLHYDCLIMVKQFRPPMGCYCLELPAGLIDDGETAEVAALRELLEETGYRGEISETTPDLCLDPGLTNCTMQYVTVNINGDDSENLHPKQRLDDGEFVEVILIPMNELRKKLDEMLQKENIVVDARVYAFAMGLMYASSKPNMLPVLKA